jgi:hypothetical protein
VHPNAPAAQLAARLQLLETPESGDHVLAHLIAVALDDLQIGAASRGLAAEVHGVTPHAGTHTQWHYTIAKMTPRSKQINSLSHVSPLEV